MRREKSLRELRNELYSGYFVCVLFLCGVIFRNAISWEWLRVGIICGFVLVLFDLVSLQYKFLKLKKLHSKKDKIE
ncbi:hypothetical protein AYP97_10170 [Lactobacillus crispatus]|uniref:hypothetical protein n=1 Tax=Lactobacillus TaxID=1578 RepID=UPI000B5D940C|nr:MULTISPECIES: hypothetical protein [Lactobacillus]OXC49144.1 hypothetical protein AYP98_01405 [Lactobacillus crispatus]OXC49669.1 hypothetical protein AYP96_03520 [Lactobacillus crispatus]OXC51266.1 hypothetical protein AYP97_10170 [Lactobacillus crispatus]OXC53436.1 hypothetical protein AYP99_06565 [Lactobacillus crispatus]OXC56089.1 hypothetical protein AYQ00_04330 [Lactobacillus crispatus]